MSGTTSEHTIARRFDEIVRRCPDRVAFETAGCCATYLELDRAANRIAQEVLHRRGDRAEPVAVLMDRDLASIASVVALAKAGKIHVPLDPSFPARRLAELVADCRPGLLLASERHAALARAACGDACSVLDPGTLDGRVDDVDLPLAPDTLAYVIYTSGSTGRPRGVAHSHSGVLHQVRRHTTALDICAEDRIAQLGSGGAAQSNTQMWVTLLNGATLYPRDLRREGLANLAAWIDHHRITYFRSSASLFRRWAAQLTARGCATLRLVAIGGEPVYRSDAELHRARFHRDCVLVNALSSTETGTLCMQLLHHGTPLDGDAVPVGRPLEGIELRLVDESGSEVATGETGEIEARSRGLAVGYWTRDGLDREDFPEDPGIPGLHRFRTGDLARRDAGGLLFNLGRRDGLVKIAGHRIFVEEVERAIRVFPHVADVAVVDRDGTPGERQLVACIVAGPEQAPEQGELRRLLTERLPAHMVPARFEFVAELPLTASGKVDRRALRAQVTAGRQGSGGRLSLLGMQLAAIWEDLLGVTGIGPDDDFMDLGGGSLLAMDLLVRIERACGRRLLPSQLLDGRLTIARLVDLLATDRRAGIGEALVAVKPEGSRTPLFFLHGDHEHGGLYCHALARGLASDQPFYAVTPHGLDGDALPWSIEDMARERLAAIRRLQPRGPYRLGGFCTGGLIAFEMARQLEAQHERVESLLLIDAAFDNAPLTFRIAGRSMRLAAATLRWDDETRRRRFLRLREALEHLDASGRAGRFGRTRHAIAKLRSLGNRGAMASPGQARILPSAAPPEGHIAQHEAYGRRRRDYLAGRIAAPIALFRSEYLRDRPPAAGWHGFAPRVVERILDASHQQTLTRHIAKVAEWMQAQLGERG